MARTYWPVPRPAINPECAEGKHHNCDEVALDHAADVFVSCECDCHSGRWAS